MIALKIDVTKLRKEKFYRSKKGIYADLPASGKPNEFGDENFGH
jgi:hypothetical protein